MSSRGTPFSSDVAAIACSSAEAAGFRGTARSVAYPPELSPSLTLGMGRWKGEGPAGWPGLPRSGSEVLQSRLRLHGLLGLHSALGLHGLLGLHGILGLERLRGGFLDAGVALR